MGMALSQHIYGSMPAHWHSSMPALGHDSKPSAPMALSGHVGMAVSQHIYGSMPAHWHGSKLAYLWLYAGTLALLYARNLGVKMRAPIDAGSVNEPGGTM
jgi:hypothetical protein